MTPADLATLRAIWPAIVKTKSGWPPEPVGVIFGWDGCSIVDGRYAQGLKSQMIQHSEPHPQDVPDLTLPGTRAAVLAWLGMTTVLDIGLRKEADGMAVDVTFHSPTTCLAALVRWHGENCG